MYLYSRAW